MRKGSDIYLEGAKLVGVLYNMQYQLYIVNHDIHLTLNSCGVRKKNDSWKSSVIYFMRICNTGVLLVSNGKKSCVI